MPSHGLAEFDTSYIEYQKRYQGEVRESDKWLAKRVSEYLKDLKNPILLDMGCCTGNFLKHLRTLIKNGFFYGVDIVEDYIRSCMHRDDLRGILFETKDILEKSLYPEVYDAIVANMSMMFMTDTEYQIAMNHMAYGLKRGASLFVMDYMHPYAHSLEITEKTDTSPFSVTFRMRPQKMLEAICEKADLEKPVFENFYMPFELESEGIKTHTRKSKDGKNLSFRGTLYQPWCLMIARKS